MTLMQSGLQKARREPVHLSLTHAKDIGRPAQATSISMVMLGAQCVSFPGGGIGMCVGPLECNLAQRAGLTIHRSTQCYHDNVLQSEFAFGWLRKAVLAAWRQPLMQPQQALCRTS